MVPQFYQPQDQLRSMVNNYMVFQCDFDRNAPMPKLPMPPMPEHRLFFYPHDAIEADYFLSGKRTTLAASTIVGPQVERLNISLGYRHTVIKVGFQPGALHRLLGVPMTELLRTEAFTASEILGNEIESVNEQLREATSIHQMIIVIEHFLLAKMNTFKRKSPIDDVLAVLLKGKGLISIDRLSSEACLSNRQFERVFKERIGLSPKFFSRLVRFSNAWVIKENKPTTSWLDIAHQCGYFDQMHLIRDFKEFAGCNPSQIEPDIQQMPFNPQNKVYF